MSTTNNISTPLELTVTQAAAEKFKALIHEKDDPSLCLRVLVTTGGCHGLEYDFAFDSIIDKDTDKVFEAHGITVVVDEYSLKRFLNQSTIHYENKITSERFIVDNPNAASTCGCGTSFCGKEESLACEEDTD